MHSEPSNTPPRMERQNCNWWEVEPQLGRVADGVADRVERLKAIGNGQVPIVVAKAFQLLMNEDRK